MKELFNRQQNFDLYDLPQGHRERFMAKLENRERERRSFSNRIKWAVAAGLILLLGLGAGFHFINSSNRRSEDEIYRSEQYFSGIIRSELNSIQKDRSPATLHLFNDALAHIERLEIDYRKLVKDYRQNQDKRILNAIIENYQQRIDILRNVKKQIHELNRNKTSNHDENRA